MIYQDTIIGIFFAAEFWIYQMIINDYKSFRKILQIF